MRRILVILALLFAASLAFGQTPINGSACGGGSSTCPLASTLSITTGNTLACFVTSSPTTSTLSVTDNNTTNDTFNPVAATKVTNATMGVVGEWFVATAVATNASVQITAHATSSPSNTGIACEQYSAGYTTTDQTATNAVTSFATSLTTGTTPTTTVASELLLGGFVLGGTAGTYTATGSFTLRQSATSGYPTYIQDRSVSSTGAYASTATITSSERYIGAILTLSNVVTAAVPTFSPVAGTYNNNQSVALSTSAGSVICYNTTGAPATNGSTGCTTGTLYTGPVTVSSSETIYASAGGTGYANSAVASAAYTLQVANPAPVFGPSGAMTFTEATIGASLYYNNTGSTATCSSTLYTGAVYASGTNPISIIGCLSGYSNSSVVSVQPDIPVASDNFQSYYNANIGVGYSYVTAVTNGPPLQLPMDCNWTGSGPSTTCNWKIASGTGTCGPGGCAIYPTADTVLGGSAVDLISWGTSSSAGSGTIQLVRTKEGYYANQGALVYMHSGATWAAGPAVDCLTNGTWCYTLTFSSGNNTASLQRWVSGTATSIAFASSGVTWADGSFAELRLESGCVLRPLLNGAPIAGLSATYTDAGCTTGGQPGVAIVFGGSSPSALNVPLYNFSAYNVAGTSGAYTPPTVPAPTTYTDSMSGSSWTWQPPLSTPWTTNGFSSAITNPGEPWTAPFIPESYGAGYVAGTASTSSAQMNYQAVFGVNQWQAVSVPTLPPWKTFNWLVKLLSQNLIPGLTNGVCTANSRGTVCFDTTSYYFGENPLSTDTGICATDKDPYSCTPFVYVDKVTPWSSSTGAPQGSNAVQTLQGSTTTIMPDDSLYVQENNGWLSLYCKQNATPLPTWSSAMTITAGTTYIEGSGMVWLASTSGVAGLTQPIWPTGASWTRDPTTGIGSGTVVSDGTGAWMYYGDTCPSTTKYTQILHVYDPDLITPSAIPPNYTSPIGVGFPGLFAGCQNDSTLGVTCSSGVPFFTSFSAGTLGYGTGNPCGVNGGPSSSCIAPVTYSPSSFIP